MQSPGGGDVPSLVPRGEKRAKPVSDVTEHAYCSRLADVRLRMVHSDGGDDNDDDGDSVDDDDDDDDDVIIIMRVTNMR